MDLQFIHATEESHEPAKYVIVSVEDGEFSKSDNSCLPKRKGDKFTCATKPPCSEKSEINRSDSKTSSIKLDKKVTNDFDGTEKVQKSHSDKNELSRVNNAALDGVDNVELTEQTERYISGKSENCETDKSQDNQSVNAMTENDVTEIPEDDISGAQDTKCLSGNNGNSEHNKNKSLMKVENEEESEDDTEEIVEEIVEEIALHGSNSHITQKDLRPKDGNENETGDEVEEDVYSELIKTASIYEKSKTSDNGKDNSVVKEEESSDSIKTQIFDESKSPSTVKDNSDVAKNDTQSDSIKTEIFEELIDDYIQEEERKMEAEKNILQKGDYKRCCDSLIKHFCLFACVLVPNCVPRTNCILALDKKEYQVTFFLFLH